MTVLLGCLCVASSARSQEIVQAMLGNIPDSAGASEILDCGGLALAAVRPDFTKDPALLRDPEANFSLAYRGDVVNHKEQRRLNPSYAYMTDSEAESILAAYAEQGMRSILTHNGPFCMIVHEQQAGLTRIIRDRFGQMALYYTVHAEYFAFSTDIRALLAVVSPRLNTAAISYQAFEFTVGEETLYQGIFAVTPGGYLELSQDGRFTKKRYWTIWETLIETPSEPEKAIDQMQGLLEEAMYLRTRQGHPVAVLASGGIDSSLVACMMKPAVIHHVHYDFSDFNELEYAQCLAEHTGAQLRLIEPSKDEYLKDKDAILHAVGMPTIWTSFTLWSALKAIREDGFNLVFTGDGADELFAGYHRYHLLFHDEQIKHLDAMQGYSYLIQRYYGSRVERYARLINRYEDQNDTRVSQYLVHILSEYSEHCGDDIIKFMTLTDFYTTSQALLLIADRLGTYFSVKTRSPFLDYRLVQFAFSLDAGLKIREGNTKWILKKIAERVLPEKITRRKDKRGFSAPINRWFGWQQPGQYGRQAYKNHVFFDWLRLFGVERT